MLSYGIVILLLAHCSIALKTKMRNTRKVRKVKQLDETKCQYVFAGRAASTTVIQDIAGSGAVYPADAQASNQNAVKNAEAQASAGRGFFYNPGSEAKVVLQKIAKTFASLITSTKKFWDNLLTFQRQDTGTWQRLKAVMEIVAPLGFSDLAKTKTMIEDQVATMSRGDFSNANTLLGLCGIIGDVGAQVQDKYFRLKTDLDAGSIYVADRAVEFFKIIDNKTKVCAICNTFGIWAPDKYYLGKKPAERLTCSQTNVVGQAKTKMTPARKGAFNKGEDSDKAMKIRWEKTLPAIAWPWQTVPEPMVKQCPNEPWAGHFSGSYYELLLMFELLSDTHLITNPVELVKQRKILAGIAAAFLQATGMHTSIEFYCVAMHYTKQADTCSIPKFAKDWKCPNATNAMNKLIAAITG